jgi:hypothetical protein
MRGWSQNVVSVGLNELHAWEDAQPRAGQYRWTPNAAQADAIARYAEDASGGPDALLEELNRVR